MIEFKNGNIFEDEAEALVNTVNCVGVMGRGIALQFKKRYPENFASYEKACREKEIQPGKMFVFETGNMMNPQYIINFPTKRHWRGASRLEDIESGLVDLVKVIRERSIASIAIPPLGCGLGGLDWQLVRERMENAFHDLESVRFYLYPPNGSPAATEMARNCTVPAMTSGRAAMIELIKRYLDGLLDPFITLLEVHKLLYFLQYSGEKLRLNYVKGPYGPYTDNLRHVLHRVEGYFISGYADGGDAPDKQLQLVPGAEEEAKEFLRQHAPETCLRINRVATLVDGFETPFGLELLATVHWVIVNESAHSIRDVIRLVYSWNAHKRQFSERQINLAINRLAQNDWIPSVS